MMQKFYQAIFRRINLLKPVNKPLLAVIGWQTQKPAIFLMQLYPHFVQIFPTILSRLSAHYFFQKLEAFTFLDFIFAQQMPGWRNW